MMQLKKYVNTVKDLQLNKQIISQPIHIFVCFVSLHPCQQSFSNVGTGLPWLNQY